MSTLDWIKDALWPVTSRLERAARKVYGGIRSVFVRLGAGSGA